MSPQTTTPSPNPVGADDVSQPPVDSAPATESEASVLDPELPPELAPATSDPVSLSADSSAGDATPGNGSEAASPEAPSAASIPDAVIPAPYGTDQRVGFWRRIRMGRTQRMAREEARDGRVADMDSRLAAIDARLSSMDQGIGLRFDRVDQRFLQFWEMEEQLTQLGDVSDRLEEIRRSQAEVVAAATAVRKSMRTHSLIFTVGALMLAAAVAALVMLRI